MTDVQTKSNAGVIDEPLSKSIEWLSPSAGYALH